ncbi:hypothetical protein ZIOFF_036456 [Zingiber officinale]|uniref:Multiprotein bridging factor 1 N-terminal domain-containing protein n=1 Tax=Zingiber officinale TaxID=94328 RepID=A0A8J5GBL2_ZINOF|nr:hypothetical protein ZIOFF_036456 [Zingiber officinale]
MAGIGPISQDWESVVLRKKASTAAAEKDGKAVNAARRSGAEIETIKKGTQPSIRSVLLPFPSLFWVRIRSGGQVVLSGLLFVTYFDMFSSR